MAEDPRDWEPETQAVRGGLMRTEHGEISEALFLTQSFAYDSAQAADDRFAGNSAGFIYQRFGNPTTRCSRIVWRCWRVPSSASPRPPAWPPSSSR